MADKSPSAFRTISEVAETLDLPQHVLRFWETKFPSVKPMKRGGGRRYYRPEDLDLLRRIRDLLYDEGYTIKGVQKLLKQHGAKALISGEFSGASTPSEAIEAPSPSSGVSGGDHAASIRQAITELRSVKELLQSV